MKILLTGTAGFAGFTLAKGLLDAGPSLELLGLDNLSRPGAERNAEGLRKLGVNLIRGDVRSPSDIDSLPAADWVIDCSANPSVLAGVNGQVSSRQLLEHNLLGTINLLEYCKIHGAGFILLSTSRVYSAQDLAAIPVSERDDQYTPADDFSGPGVTFRGLAEDFPTNAPISLYGASKLTSESLILEYAEAFGFPVWINRCSVLAGAGQFGKSDQGIFSFWIHSFREKRPLKYIGFDGSGLQVRDALHPRDLISLLLRQMQDPGRDAPRILNLGGGPANATSLRKLSAWCDKCFGSNEVTSSREERPYDAPWIVMDSTRAKQAWDWQPKTSLNTILSEIADHAEAHPDWLRKTT